MNHTVFHSEGPSSRAGSCTACPIGLPTLRSSLQRSSRLLHARGSSVPSPHSRRVLPVLAIQAPERTLDPERGDAAALPEHVQWFKQNKEFWVEAESQTQLVDIMAEETEKFIVVDFYAGWCSSCKAAYPALCKVAANPKFTKDFLFVKADVQKKEIASYIRTLGVKGIPTVVVFAPGGEKLAHFGASFRKITLVKANLTVIGANKGRSFVTDSEGYVFPKPE